MLVQQLKSVCPLTGKQRIADTLARADLHLSASTVGRMVKKKLSNATPPERTKRAGACSDRGTAGNAADSDATETASGKPKRVVTAKYPGHVWHIDLTAVPTRLGLWIPWFPNSWTEHWPFCFWVLAVVDHFSRKAVMLKCFRGTPCAAELTDSLDIAIACADRAPKYIISDQGSQFREHYKDWCELRGVKPRFGAIGQHGSIAVVERFIRTVKDECTRRIIMPLAGDAFDRDLIAYASWYNDYRPHQTLHGRTPNEICEGHVTAGADPV